MTIGPHLEPSGELGQPMSIVLPRPAHVHDAMLARRSGLIDPVRGVTSA
jgi:hypothetical protein